MSRAARQHKKPKPATTEQSVGQSVTEQRAAAVDAQPALMLPVGETRANLNSLLTETDYLLQFLETTARTVRAFRAELKTDDKTEFLDYAENLKMHRRRMRQYLIDIQSNMLKADVQSRRAHAAVRRLRIHYMRVAGLAGLTSYVDYEGMRDDGTPEPDGAEIMGLALEDPRFADLVHDVVDYQGDTIGTLYTPAEIERCKLLYRESLRMAREKYTLRTATTANPWLVDQAFALVEEFKRDRRHMHAHEPHELDDDE